MVVAVVTDLLFQFTAEKFYAIPLVGELALERLGRHDDGAGEDVSQEGAKFDFLEHEPLKMTSGRGVSRITGL